jgi:hypothetical protein
MTFYSYVYDMVEEHLASKQLHPQRELIEVAVDWPFSNFFSTHPPYQRFPHDGESALDAFFRVSASKDKSHKVIISIQYGTNKTSLQHLYGNDSKGITDRLNLSLWLSSKGKEESPAIQIPETSSDDRSLARAMEAASSGWRLRRSWRSIAKRFVKGLWRTWKSTLTSSRSR